MFRPRLIPVLLLQGNGLVKTRKFARPTYLGDPINAVRIFNDLEADELIFLDISATQQNRSISLEFVQEVASEAHMPFAAGGGLQTLAQIREVLACGAEKVVLGTAAVQDPEFVRRAAAEFGSSAIAVCLDFKSSFWRGTRCWYRNATQCSQQEPWELASLMASVGAGELILQSVDRDGTWMGYDLETIRQVVDSVTIPVVALGGANSLQELPRAFFEAGATGLAAGSLFVFHDSRGGVLLNYPPRSHVQKMFRR